MRGWRSFLFSHCDGTCSLDVYGAALTSGCDVSSHSRFFEAALSLRDETMSAALNSGAFAFNTEVDDAFGQLLLLHPVVWFC